MSDEQFAARAVLPLALNEISAYAEKCMLIFNESMNIADEDEKRITLKKLLNQPFGLLNTIKDAIRYSDDAQKKELSRIVAFYQVQSSRIRDHIDFAAGGPGPSFSASQALIDAARLYSATSKIYSWARRDEDGGRINVSNADLMSTLRICIPDYEGNSMLVEHIKIFRLDVVGDMEIEK